VLPLAEIEPNAFHIIGGCFAIWAVVLAVLGFTRPDFPAGKNAQRVVLLISFSLMAASVASAIISGEKEEVHTESKSEEGPRPAADNPPRGP
jgi:hypothetical protein